jgi:predicted ATPase
MTSTATSAARRARERQALDGLLDRVRGGESAVLVIRGEAGIGKTALMHYCARQALAAS